MKLVSLPPTPVQRPTLQSALDAVFGPAMLRRVHGPDTVATPFAGGAEATRTFCFHVDVGAVPWPLRRFLCGSRLRVTTEQTLRRQPRRWHVTNHLKMHFVGAELFRMHPEFWLDDDAAGRVTIGGSVAHHARLPPPLNAVAESFMAARSRRELLRFAQCLAAEGVISREGGVE